MGSLKDYFKIDTTLGLARPDCIFKGEKYRKWKLIYRELTNLPARRKQRG